MSAGPPLRIIQVFNRYLQAGGEEKSVGRIADDLESGGHRVVRYWRASEEWKGPQAPSKVRQALWLWNHPEALDALEALHHREKADLWLLHNVVPVVSLGVYRRALKLGVPIIQWLHNYRPLSVGASLFAGTQKLEPEDRWISLKESLAGSWNGRLMTSWLAMAYAWVRWRGDFESVKAWVAVSDEMKDIFARGRWYPERLHSVRHSWHLTANEPSSQDQGHFLFLGRMIEPKGVRFLIDLWRDPSLSSVPLIMAGQGPLADELKTQSPPNVKWVGQIQGAEKERWISTCRGIVFPCLWAEPLSTVAYEAYERGKPILASALGGMKEIIVDQQTGRLLPPGDKQAWLQALHACTPEEARRCGLIGRKWLLENVTPAVWNRQFEAIARSIVTPIAH